MNKFCAHQAKCIEDTDDTWTCLAHLAEARAMQCHMDPQDVRIIDGQIVCSKQGRPFGVCSDFESTKDAGN
jgi:hypothetical protein